MGRSDNELEYLKEKGQKQKQKQKQKKMTLFVVVASNLFAKLLFVVTTESGMSDP
jgi:hypothetical protein